MSQDLLSLDPKQLELLAQAAVNTEVSAQTGATMISTRSGRMSIKGMPIPNDTVTAIILCSPIERLFYDGDFDGEKLVPPACSAMANMAQDLKPFESSLNPQHPTCDGCKRDAWGSASTPDKVRKGKACRETRRIVLLVSDDVESSDSVNTAGAYAIRPPVTSLVNYSTYVKQVAVTLRKPLFAVVTKISLVPDNKSQFKMKFDFVKEITDTATLVALMGRSQKELNNVLSNASTADFKSLETDVAEDALAGDVPF